MRHFVGSIVLLALIAGCHDPTEPEPVALPLALRVHAARDRVTSGDTVTMQLVARNLSADPVTFLSSFGCVLGVSMENEEGTVHETLVSGAVGSCPSPGTTVTIAPGDSLVQTGTWEASYLVGGDVSVRAEPGVWMLRPKLSTREEQETLGLYLPAIITVLPR